MHDRLHLGAGPKEKLMSELEQEQMMLCQSGAGALQDPFKALVDQT